MLVAVGEFDELPQRTPTIVTARGRQIVLVRWGDDVYALHGTCPHMSQSFKLGSVRGRPGGAPGEYAFDDDEPVLTCPWHQFEYRLSDGRCLVDPRLRIRRYEVTVREDGKIIVDIRSPRATRAQREEAAAG
jgi:nitrite reductase (NADH) small subunit